MTTCCIVADAVVAVGQGAAAPLQPTDGERVATAVATLLVLSLVWLVIRLFRRR